MQCKRRGRLSALQTVWISKIAAKSWDKSVKLKILACARKINCCARANNRVCVPQQGTICLLSPGSAAQYSRESYAASAIGQRCGSSILGRALISNFQVLMAPGTAGYQSWHRQWLKPGFENPAVCGIGSYGWPEL